MLNPSTRSCTVALAAAFITSVLSGCIGELGDEWTEGDGSGPTSGAGVGSDSGPSGGGPTAGSGGSTAAGSGDGDGTGGNAGGNAGSTAAGTGGSDGSTTAGAGGSGGSPAGGTGGSGGNNGGSTGAAQLCVDTINQHRATLGLPPLARWVEAESCSDGESESDGNANQPHGAFGACDERAQNECPGWGGPPESMIVSCLQAMWDEGPGEDFNAHGHYINMSNTEYTQVACGFHTFPDGSVWAVQNFR